MAILESVRELASKLGAETNGRDITDQINKINKHLDETALGGRDIASAVRTYSENASGGSGGSQPRKDVNFYDYDGTIVASYSAVDFANLSAMPANPTHEGLTAQGWNWSLSDAKTYVAANGKLNIGQLYITSDGKTRLHIKLSEGRLKPYLGLKGTENGTEVSIDWGDDSSAETVVLNTSTVYTPHEYTSEGTYVISISVTNGEIRFTGDMSYGSNIFRKSTTPDSDADVIYRNILTNIEVGSKVTTFGSSGFMYCRALSSITIPNSVTTIGSNVFMYCSSLSSITIPDGDASIDGYVFQNCSSLSSIIFPKSVTFIGQSLSSCSSLSSVTIPDGVTTIGSSAFGGCALLSSVTIPDGVTSIGQQAFYGCSSLSSVTIPDGVTSIGNLAFYGCRGLGFVKFKGTTPPTVSNSNAWNDVPTDCIIYVPTGSLTAYTSASNYPSSSTYTYIEY